jgi:hypothetical protein
VTEQTAGMLKNLTIATNGAYKGTVLINGAKQTIKGTFDAEGQASNYVSRAASQGGPLTLAMTLNVNQPFPQVTGSVSGTANGAPWVASLIADRATNTQPAAEYTMLLPPDTNNAPPTLSPGGDSYFLITNYTGTVKNPAAAAVRIAGMLADGTVFNQSVPVSQDGYVPMYASLYANKGLLLGWINLNATALDNVGLTWIRPAHASGIYKSGFTNELVTNQILLSPWVDPAISLGYPTELTTRQTIDDPAVLDNYSLTLSKEFAFGNPGAPPVISGSINRKTGFFKVVLSVQGNLANLNGGNVQKGNQGVTPGSGGGTTLSGVGDILLTGFGAILQNANSGGGFFLTATNAQAVQLNP